MENEKRCWVCGNPNVEAHHSIFKSKCKPLEHCELVIYYLCPEHHRSSVGVHGRDGHELDLKLKLDFQNKLEMLFDKEYLTEDDIQQTLGISDRAMKSLSKTLKKEKDGTYSRESVIISCMGGRLYE